MAPLEVVALNAFPMRTAISGAESRSIKAANVKYVGMMGIDGQIVNVLRFREEGAPRFAAVV